MSLKTLFAACALTLAAVGAAAAHAVAPDAPGLDVEDRCTAAALRESGWRGALRVRLPPRADRSMRDCDVPAVALEVPDFVAVAKPCLARALREHGYRGRIRPPHHTAYTSHDPACDFDYGADASAFGAPGPAPAEGVVTFRRGDGKDITVMRPIPNPEDLPPRERRRIYGRN